jgi:hypothetical protein
LNSIAYITRLVLFTCLLPLSGIAQSESDSSFKLRINLNAAVIVNRAFSNVPRKVQPIDEFTTEKRSATDSGSKYRAGFTIGADLLFFPKEHLKGVLGIAFSRYSAAHHYLYESVGPTNRPGFSELKTVTNLDYEQWYSSVEIQAGIRNQLVEPLFLTSLLVLTKPVSVTQTVKGRTDTYYSNNSGGSENFTVIVNEEKRKVEKPPQNISLRFAVDYQFGLGASPARVYLARNLGIIYTQPWWLIGFSYTVKN